MADTVSLHHRCYHASIYFLTPFLIQPLPVFCRNVAIAEAGVVAEINTAPEEDPGAEKEDALPQFQKEVMVALNMTPIDLVADQLGLTSHQLVEPLHLSANSQVQ